MLTAAALLRLALAAVVPLFPDETYYWDWSRHLAAGYFDHPPMVALLIRAGTALLGDTALGVRLGTIVAGWVAALATAAIARRLGGDGAALRASVAISVLPLAAAGLVLTTPDAPLLAMTAVGLYCVVRALESPLRSPSSSGWWALTGVALGLAFSSKYTSILLPVGVVLAVLARRDLRARLAEPGPYVACVVATLVFLPVLRWNAHHEWISFTYQLRHGLGASHASWIRPLQREGDLIGGQAGLASPILFVLCAVVVWRALRRPRSDIAFVLGTVSALAFLFFCYSALKQRVEPNWPAPAYIPALVLLATEPWTPRGHRWLHAGFWLAGALSTLIYLHAASGLLPIPARKDPLGRAAGWTRLAARADAARRELDARGGAGTTTWLGGDRYQEASELAFHLPDHPSTIAANLSGRPNQYDLWPRFADRARPGDNLVLALDESTEPHGTVRALSPYFASATRGELVELRSPRGVVGERRLWLLAGWRGGWPR